MLAVWEIGMYDAVVDMWIACGEWMFDWPWEARLSYGTPEYAALPTTDCDISRGGVLTPTLDSTLAREDVVFEAG